MRPGIMWALEAVVSRSEASWQAGFADKDKCLARALHRADSGGNKLKRLCIAWKVKTLYLEKIWVFRKKITFFFVFGHNTFSSWLFLQCISQHGEAQGLGWTQYTSTLMPPIDWKKQGFQAISEALIYVSYLVN